MEKIKKYIFSNFEGIFVLLTLVSVAVVNYFVYSKLAFLNFYYLPIILIGYYLGKRRAVLGAFLVILLVWFYVLQDPVKFTGIQQDFDLFIDLLLWGGFLILSASVIGTLSEKLKSELERSRQISQELEKEREKVSQTNKELSKYTNQLEERVSERTFELERSNKLIESLKGKVEKALFTVMDATVARMMVEGKLRNEKRRISILFSDLQDFVGYSENYPPETVVEQLNKYLNDMEECINKYFGHIDRFMGDGIMCEFGAPVEYRMHPLMAVTAGMKMQERLRALKHPWKMRVGIATGPAVLGLFGSKRKAYSCIGDAVNLASRLEGICEPGSVYIDEETYRAVEPYVECQQVFKISYGGNDYGNWDEIKKLFVKLSDDPENQEVLYELGKTYMQNGDTALALEYFEKILHLNPDNVKAKVDFAEANLKQKEIEKISIKGKKFSVAVYKVTGFKDPLLNREKIPEPFYQKYKDVPQKYDIPNDVVLPMEVIDGSIGHTKMAAIIAYAIGENMGLSDRQLEDVYYAAFFHDLGKEIIPHQILTRPEKLTPTEFEEVKKHPVESVQLIKKLGYQDKKLLALVEYHHENYDGTGYPHGLKGENIPLGSRIIAVADAFVALTSKTLYRETWEYRSALKEIENDTENGKYDIQVVQVLNSLMGVSKSETTKIGSI